MTVTSEDIIDAYGLKLHPYEGWSIESGHIAGKERTFLWLITAEMFIPWHQMPAETRWSVIDGDGCAVSVSTEGSSTSSVVLGRSQLPAITIAAHADQTLTSIGRYSLLEGRLRPDIALTDRIDRPDHWYPRPEIGDDVPF